MCVCDDGWQERDGKGETERTGEFNAKLLMFSFALTSKSVGFWQACFCFSAIAYHVSMIVSLFQSTLQAFLKWINWTIFNYFSSTEIYLWMLEKESSKAPQLIWLICLWDTFTQNNKREEGIYIAFLGQSYGTGIQNVLVNAWKACVYFPSMPLLCDDCLFR